jgi:hypothetical protein
MSLNFHASAVANFNQKSSEFVKLVKEFPIKSAHSHGFPSEVHIAATLTADDIIGDIDLATTDYRGQTITKYFHFENRRYGLDEEDYKLLVKMAEQIQLLPTAKNKLSLSFVEKTLFSWVSAEFQNADINVPFIEHLENEANKAIKTVSLWVPIANLEVEVPFPVSKSEVRPLSKCLIDNWQSRISTLSDDHKEKASELFDKVRKDYQGLAAVYTVVKAEPKRAQEHAIEEAQLITSILGIFSGATLLPDIKCVSCIKGAEYIAQSTSFSEQDGEGFYMNSNILDKSTAKYWRLSQKDIFEIRRTALDRISNLLAAESLNAFKKTVLNSILLYSKSAFTADPVEKVVYMLSALESILLRNENEPIQQNLAERMAVFTAQELTKRKSIINTIKSTYGIRSRYLHHGHTSSELELISEFMMCTWVFIIQLIANVEQFSSKESFISAIDDQKLG